MLAQQHEQNHYKNGYDLGHHEGYQLGFHEGSQQPAPSPIPGEEVEAIEKYKKLLKESIRNCKEWTELAVKKSKQLVAAQSTISILKEALREIIEEPWRAFPIATSALNQFDKTKNTEE